MTCRVTVLSGTRHGEPWTHARVLSDRPLCDPTKKLDDCPEQPFELDHRSACRPCIHRLVCPREVSYYDWLASGLSEERQQVFKAAFDTLVDPSGQVTCAEDTAYLIARAVPLSLARGTLEVECTSCGETFCPENEQDLIHEYTAHGIPCGGQGALKGSWR